MKRRWFTVVLLLVGLLSVVGILNAITIRNTLRMVDTVQNLKDVGMAYSAFVNANKRLPTSFDELDLEARSLFDPATELPFQWVPPDEAFDLHGATLVAKQPTSVYVGFWPFGERRQNGAFSDGSVGDIYGR